MSPVAKSFETLQPPMQRALHGALEALCAGSLGIGAVVAKPDGEIVSTGRNRLWEADVGEDKVAGTSLAHAEINALSKLRYRAHEGQQLALHTTLQPCLQCLGAIRLAPIVRVSILAPDPLWTGVERLRTLTPFIASRWPEYEFMRASVWSVFALLSPTAGVIGIRHIEAPWRAALPTTSALVDATDMQALASVKGSVVDVVESCWRELDDCVAEVEQLAELAREQSS